MAKSFNSETDQPGQSEYGSITGESKGAQRSSATQNREFGSEADLNDRSAEFYDQTKKTISDTYNKTAEALNKSYDQAMAYGRDNPGKVMLMALGGGLVLGLLLAGRNRRSGFNVEPVVNTLSQMFSDVFRRRWV
jgi:ElaB/YqjD/DUF883 family membrane-anchored ribosome-binding protein